MNPAFLPMNPAVANETKERSKKYKRRTGQREMKERKQNKRKGNRDMKL